MTSSSILLVAFATIVITTLVGKCHSVIMPPRLTPSHIHPNETERFVLLDRRLGAYFEDFEPQEPYQLTISELSQSASVSAEVDSITIVTLSLNKAVEEELQVNVTVFSKPDLIYFKVKDTIVKDASIIVTYKQNSYGDRAIYLKTVQVGHAQIVCKILKQPSNITIDDSSAFISVDIYKSWSVSLIVSIVGWIYFFAWSISFYFQLHMNYSRKSVVGLNFDFLALNLLGFTAYAIYNLTLLFSTEVQQDYYTKNPFHRIPVEYNDLFFSLHSLLVTILTIVQCFIYERGEQKVSLFASIFIASICVISFALYICHLLTWVAILNVVLFVSYVKLVVTLIKYVPQAWMNHKNKSTEGWSILNIVLDFTGGVFSLMQMFFLAYNYDNWISIFLNPTKFGLGLFSICFDITFFIQHFVLYKNTSSSIDGNNLADSSRNSEDNEEDERKRRLQASSGAIQSSQTDQQQGAYINEDLIA